MKISMSLPIVAGGLYDTASQFNYIDHIRITNIMVNGKHIRFTDMTYRESGTPDMFHLEIFKTHNPHFGGMLQVNRNTGVIETFVMSDLFIDDVVVTLELDGERG